MPREKSSEGPVVTDPLNIHPVGASHEINLFIVTSLLFSG